MKHSFENLNKFWSIANEEACEANQLIEEAKKNFKIVVNPNIP
jgi:hypothetical protein